MWRLALVLALAGLSPSSLSELDRSLLDGVREGCVEEVRRCLAEGADPEAVEDSFWVPAVLVAAEYGHEGVLRLLLDAGADPDAKGHGIHYLGTTALMEAAHYGHLDALRLLLERGASVNEESDTGWTALIEAAGSGEPRAVKALLGQGADPRKKGLHDYTALMAAASAGDLAAVRLLLDAGADPAVRDADGRTAVDWALLNKHVKAAHVISQSSTRPPASSAHP
jgi:uncharacterized protein